MALALRSAAPLQPDVILAQAISEFEQALSPDQKADLDDLRKRSLRSAPSRDDVLRVTADVNHRLLSRRRESGLSRCFGTRFTNVLQSVQRYASLGDVVIGHSQSILACGIWAVVRMTIHVCIDLGTYLDKVSHFFMVAGHTAPRYESMAHLYRRSNRLSRYMSQYFTVVVKSCHDFILFSRKSAIGQLTASLDDSKIRNAQTELERLAHNIREEVSFLSSEKIEDEAKENGMFRALVTSNHKWETQQRKARLKTRLLEALSAMEHEIPFRQARNRGTSTVFRQGDEYGRWRDSSQPAALLLSGKLGSGKSVTMASIVDDLYLRKKDSAVAHVFCRHDNTDSLTARAVMGSLSRQLVDKYFNDSLLDSIVEGAPLTLDMADVIRLSKEVVKLDTRVYLVLDGLDECSRHEAGGIIKALESLKLHMRLSVCVSCRTGADAHTDLFKSWKKLRTMEMPNDNPDIGNFIQEELQRRIECGKLVLGNAGIILDIREALIQGAKGMFLWVVLQIESLCEEKSDRAIRAALEDLPPDLSTTFTRILKRSRKSAHSFSYQMRILKPVAAALRPLSVNELREIISIEPGDTRWDPEQLVNDVYSALACCGSLIVVEEEDLCVRVIHQSVMQFLTTKPSTQKVVGDECNFSLTEAQRYMGDCTVTYLNYSLFETRLSSQRAQPVLVGQLPSRVMHEALTPSGMIGQLALRLLQSASKPADFDAERTLAEVANRPKGREPTDIFHFLDYATKHWLRHTARISSGSEVYRLWASLLENPRFNALIWPEGSAPQSDLVLDDDTGCLWHLSRRVMWAIANAHIPLLRYEMKGRNWCKAFASILPYLRRCLACEPRPKIAEDMCSVLLPLVAMFRAPPILEWLLSMGAVGFFDTTSQAMVKVDQQYNIARARLFLDMPLLSLYNEDALLQGAIRRKDIHMVRLLADVPSSLPRETSSEMPLNLGHALMSDLDDPAIIRIIHATCIRRPQIRNYDAGKLVIDINILSGHVNRAMFEPGPEIFRAALKQSSNVDFCQLAYTALGHYTLRGNADLVMALLSGTFGSVLLNDLKRMGQMSDAVFLILVLNSLHSISQQRVWMLRSFLRLPRDQLGSLGLDLAQRMLERCMQLRHWELAYDLLSDFREKHSTIVPEDLTRALKYYVIGAKLVYLCIEVSDYQGLRFLLDELQVQAYFERQERRSHENAGTPALQYALLADAETWPEFFDVLETVDVLLQRGALVSNIREAVLMLTGRFNLLILDDKTCLLPPPALVDFLRSLLFDIISKVIRSVSKMEAATISKGLIRCFSDAYADYFHPQLPDGEAQGQGGVAKPFLDERRKNIKLHYIDLIKTIIAFGLDATVLEPLASLTGRMEGDEMRGAMAQLMINNRLLDWTLSAWEVGPYYRDMGE